MRRPVIVALGLAALQVVALGCDGGSSSTVMPLAPRDVSFSAVAATRLPYADPAKCGCHVVRSQDEWRALAPENENDVAVDYRTSNLLVLWPSCQGSCFGPWSLEVDRVVEESGTWRVDATYHVGCPLDCDSEMTAYAYYRVEKSDLPVTCNITSIPCAQP